MYQRILFPIDLTESSEKLVPHVLTMTEQFNSQLHVLYVVRVFQYFTNIYVPNPSIDLFETELIEGAHKKMEEFMGTHFSRYDNTLSEVILGDPSDAILNYNREHDIDMVIMGTHGRKGLDRVIFGSVAERVIKWARVPVLVINPFSEQEAED
jgi:nucleotide-binding universal stress UspA family protein